MSSVCAKTRFKSELFLSHQPSVDAFLEHRPEFRDAGKLAIALSLMARENEKILNNFEKRKVGFYDYLFTQLNTSWEEFGNNKLSIITFNYDRSLEHYLFTALKHSYGKSDELIVKALSNIPIVHVHGSLGSLPWQETGGRPYSVIQFVGHPVETAKQIEPASKNILIVSDEEKSTNEFNLAFECLKSAKRIYFLGFGYHEPNLKKLRLNELNTSDYEIAHFFSNVTAKVFRGSALDWHTSQKSSIERKWGIRLPDSELNDLEFLKEYAELD
jgi:hypothetical protein